MKATPKRLPWMTASLVSGLRPARPFTLPLRAAPAEWTDLGTLVERASRFGHSLERLAASRPLSTGPVTAGAPLAGPLRQRMETAFGEDFSGVRLHEDRSPLSIGARAYARGEHIHFAPGRYRPETSTGRKLLGHELAHVVQQRAGRVPNPTGRGTPVNSDPELETEARVQGARAAQGRKAAVPGLHTPSPRSAALPLSAAAIQAANGQDDDQDDGNPSQQNQTPMMLTMEPWEDLERTGRATPRSARYPGPRQLLENPSPMLPIPLGPSTTGMASPEARKRLASRGSVLTNILKETPLPPEDLRELATEISNAELTREGVEAPELASTLTHLSIPDSLDAKSWTMNLSQTSFSGVDPVSRISTAMNTSAHESRHAEQSFWSARLLASGGATAEQIREQTGLPEHIVAQAVKKPLQVPPTGRTREMYEAEVWYHSLYGQNAPQRRQILHDYHEADQDLVNERGGYMTIRITGNLQERETARKDLELAQSVYDIEDDEYRSLPEEVDAWELGEDVGSRIREKDKEQNK